MYDDIGCTEVCVGKRATARSRAYSRTRDHMACAQARTIRVRAAALPSRSINHEPPPLQRLLLDSTFPLPYQQYVSATNKSKYGFQRVGGGTNPLKPLLDATLPLQLVSTKPAALATTLAAPDSTPPAPGCSRPVYKLLAIPAHRDRLEEGGDCRGRPTSLPYCYCRDEWMVH
jgi:hypothetical protein